MNTALPLVKRTLLALALGSAAWSASAQVATVHVHAGLGTPQVVSEAGLPLASGALVRVGSLASGFDLTRSAWNPRLVAGAWTAFGSTQVTELQGEPGRFGASLSSEAAGFAGKPVYLWIVRTKGGGEPAADGSNVLAHTLATSSKSGWRFPDARALAPANAVLLSAADVDQVWFGRRTTAALQLETSGLSYERWAGFSFDPSAPESARTYLADPEGDGVVNLLEFALGTSPSAGGAAHRANVATEADGNRYLELAFERAPGRLGMTTVVEVSGDLETWSEVPVNVRAVRADGTEEAVGRDTVPFGGEGVQRFIRLSVRESAK